MKKLLLLPVFALIAAPVSAGQLSPLLYANEYCSLRDLGVSPEEARQAAIEAAHLSSLPDAPTITIGGTRTTADVVRSVRAVSDRCPEHL